MFYIVLDLHTQLHIYHSSMYIFGYVCAYTTTCNQDMGGFER